MRFVVRRLEPHKNMGWVWKPIFVAFKMVGRDGRVNQILQRITVQGWSESSVGYMLRPHVKSQEW